VIKVIEDIEEMRRHTTLVRREGKTIGFIPTMGALHDGHLSLMRHAKGETDHVITSIFVNPTQFGPGEDYEEYPRDLEGDIEKAASAGVETLFTPSVSAIYPEGYRTFVEVEGLSDLLCGKTRPGHFRGVATIVLKLFNIVKPHKAFFGQKDYQQTVVVKKMVEDLNMDIDIIVLPTVREADGLAMSSRNQYLNPEERRSAPALYRSLQEARLLFERGEKDPGILKGAIERTLRSEPAVRVEYIAIVNPETLEGERELRKGTVIALAARIGKTRLIDNIIL